MSRFFATAALVPLSLAVLVPTSGGCANNPGASDDKICTAGNYVFCRCQNRVEGTKLCNADGKTFGACQPCPDDPPPDTTDPMGNPPAEQDGGVVTAVDSSTPPTPKGVPSIEAKCIGKLAVLAGSDTDLYMGVFAGEQSFTVSTSHGPGVGSPVSIAAMNGSLVGVYRAGKFDNLLTTKYTSSWSPPVSIGSSIAAESSLTPALTAVGSALKMLYLGTDANYYIATYATGWDDPTIIAGQTAVVSGKSAPGVASIGTSLVYSFTGDDGSLNRQMLTGNSWGSTVKVPSVSAFSTAPVMIAFDSGTKDLMMAYVGADQALHSVTRDAANKAWNAPVIVDDSARPGDDAGGIANAFSMAPMTGGRAMLVYRGTNGQPFYAVYDPAGAKWSAPAELVKGGNPTVASTPMVTQGQCGEDAVVAYAVKDGAVALERFTGSAWAGPYVVGGMSKLKYVGVGALP